MQIRMRTYSQEHTKSSSVQSALTDGALYLRHEHPIGNNVPSDREIADKKTDG
jgi:hypothetical protein